MTTPLSRESAKARLESLGAEVTSSVSRKTDLLIVGTERGQNKYWDAINKNVPILSWPMFIYLGFWEDREELQIPVDPSILTETLLLLAVQLDSIYAHFIRSGHPRLERAFFTGAAGLEKILSGAWGAGRGADHRGDETDPVRIDRSPAVVCTEGIAQIATAVVHLMVYMQEQSRGPG